MGHSARLLWEDLLIPGSFEYHRPASLSEAVALLGRLDSDARLIAGGHSLIPMMKLRLAMPTHLVDLAGVAELKGARLEGGEIVIGAMTTQREIIVNDLLAEHAPILRETAEAFRSLPRVMGTPMRSSSARSATTRPPPPPSS
jgi:carbon-monoxide dehydrogenase medium subunit